MVPAGGGGLGLLTFVTGLLMVYRYADLVAESVAQAPALTDGQLNKLTMLFTTTTTTTIPGGAAVTHAGDKQLVGAA